MSYYDGLVMSSVRVASFPINQTSAWDGVLDWPQRKFATSTVSTNIPMMLVAVQPTHWRDSLTHEMQMISFL